MKKALFWDVAPCRCGVNRRFGERIASIFRVEGKIRKSASEETVRTGASRPEDCFLHISVQFMN
jgi:hypothetical protein